jgi:hypothetical protein
VAVNLARNEVLINNITDGFNVHEFESGTWKRSYPTANPVRRMPKQVAFRENARIIIGGSDHGIAYVFDWQTVLPLQMLCHSSKGIVQTVTVSVPLKFMLLFDITVTFRHTI